MRRSPEYRQRRAESYRSPDGAPFVSRPRHTKAAAEREQRADNARQQEVYKLGGKGYLTVKARKRPIYASTLEANRRKDEAARTVVDCRLVRGTLAASGVDDGWNPEDHNDDSGRANRLKRFRAWAREEVRKPRREHPVQSILDVRNHPNAAGIMRAMICTALQNPGRLVFGCELRGNDLNYSGTERPGKPGDGGDAETWTLFWRMAGWSADDAAWMTQRILGREPAERRAA